MDEIVPTEYQLSQNYPDPFKECTTIKYCLPGKTNIRLEVLDHKGRKVKVLVNEVKEPGTYSVELSAKGLRDGLYLYRLIANGYEETKRLLLLR